MWLFKHIKYPTGPHFATALPTPRSPLFPTMAGGTPQYATWRNNAHPNWWQDAGLRKLHFWIGKSHNLMNDIGPRRIQFSSHRCNLFINVRDHTCSNFIVDSFLMDQNRVAIRTVLHLALWVILLPVFVWAVAYFTPRTDRFLMVYKLFPNGLPISIIHPGTG